MARFPRRVRSRFGVLGAMCLLASCGFSMPVPTPPTAGPQAANVGEQLPLRAGVFYDAAFLALRRQATVTGGHRAILPVGETGAAEFQAACERRFRSCVRLSAGTPLPATEAAQFDIVIEPRIEEIAVEPPPLIGWAGRWTVTTAWSFDVLTPTGTRIAEDRAAARVSTEPSVDLSLSGLENSSAALGLASRRIAEEFLRGVPRLPGMPSRFPGLVGAGP